MRKNKNGITNEFLKKSVSTTLINKKEDLQIISPHAIHSIDISNTFLTGR
jgi:hypothetical protein